MLRDIGAWQTVPNAGAGELTLSLEPDLLACDLELNSFQFPSETTSTVPSTTLMAVSSSIAYAGPDKPAAHSSAAAIVFVGRSGFSTCGKIEKSTTPSVFGDRLVQQLDQRVLDARVLYASGRKKKSCRLRVAVEWYVLRLSERARIIGGTTTDRRVSTYRRSSRRVTFLTRWPNPPFATLDVTKSGAFPRTAQLGGEHG